MSEMIKVNVEQLRDFQEPLVKAGSAVVNILAALKKCADAVGEGSGMEEAIKNDGRALEAAYNDDVIPSVEKVQTTLENAATNAEEIKKAMASFSPVNTSAVTSTSVEVGTQPAAFKMN